MANVYRMSMSATYYFNIKADSEDDDGLYIDLTGKE